MLKYVSQDNIMASVAAEVSFHMAEGRIYVINGNKYV